MKTKLFAIILSVLMLCGCVAHSVCADEIRPSFPALYTSIGETPELSEAISRAHFSMLTFEVFRTVNGGIFPQMETGNVFTDVGDKPEDIFVVMLYGIGVVNGVGEKAFAPRRAITREEGCAMLVRALLRQNPDAIDTVSKSTEALSSLPDGNDVSSWAKECVAYMVINGYLPLKDGKIAPKSEMTTEEAFILCSAFLGA